MNMIRLIKTALEQYGEKEIAGENHNMNIVAMFKEIGHNWVDDDETSWCSAFVNWVAMKCDFERTGKLNARSWLEVGHEVKKPEVGDVVILWRVKPDSWQGHVGFFIRETETGILMLGGNQSNQVKISEYSKEQLLGFRRLKYLGDDAKV